MIKFGENRMNGTHIIVHKPIIETGYSIYHGDSALAYEHKNQMVLSIQQSHVQFGKWT
jgi:hypothetical protein